MGHAKGVGLTEDELLRVKEAAMRLPYVEVRKSTGGGGLHLYVYFDVAGIPCENHTTHSALARCILGMMSSECNFDFASQIDCCGGVMWIFHRKMTAENDGLSIIKPATKVLSAADVPANWRDHIEVVTRGRARSGSTRWRRQTGRLRGPGHVPENHSPGGQPQSRSRPCNAPAIQPFGSPTITSCRRTRAALSRSCGRAKKARNWD